MKYSLLVFLIVSMFVSFSVQDEEAATAGDDPNERRLLMAAASQQQRYKPAPVHYPAPVPVAPTLPPVQSYYPSYGGCGNTNPCYQPQPQPPAWPVASGCVPAPAPVAAQPWYNSYRYPSAPRYPVPQPQRVRYNPAPSYDYRYGSGLTPNMLSNLPGSAAADDQED